MKKKQIGTIFLLVITIGLVGAIVYFNFLLNDKSPTAVTQIRKTKASAITYHKLLAMNTTPVPTSGDSPEGGEGSSVSQVSSGGGGTASSFLPAPSLLPTQPIPSPTSSLIAYRPASSQPSLLPTEASSSISSVPAGEVPDGTAGPTAVPTLLAYRTLSVTPTLIPPGYTGGDEPVGSSSSKKATVTSTPTKIPVVTSKVLPETGWVQMSMIFFIVAAATIFVSFLF